MIHVIHDYNTGLPLFTITVQPGDDVLAFATHPPREDANPATVTVGWDEAEDLIGALDAITTWARKRRKERTQ